MNKYINDTTIGKYDVVFSTGKDRVVRKFDSLFLARRFAKKVERSKRLVLISSP